VKEGCNPLRYICIDKITVEDIAKLKSSTDPKIFNHIQDLYDLIQYQMEIISEQRMDIIAGKHSKAWSMYDPYGSGKKCNRQSGGC
jgi:hypothetical protein